MKKGDKIRIIRMGDGDKDPSVNRMNGKTYTVNHIDDAGQIHLEECGLAVIPEIDEFVTTPGILSSLIVNFFDTLSSMFAPGVGETAVTTLPDSLNSSM